MAESTGSASAPAAVTIGTSASVVLASTAGFRRALVIQNVHASNDLYLGFGPDGANVTTSNGIRVRAGESYTDALNCYSGAVYGIASATNTDVRVLSF